MRTSGYLCEREVLNLCVSHPSSPWAGSDPDKCYVAVVDRTDQADPSFRWNRASCVKFPAEFWFVCENGSETFLGYADFIETIADDDDDVVLRCLSGDVYDSLNEMRDHLSNLDWSER